MSSLTISGDTSGQITIEAPAVSGTNTQTLLAATGTLAPFNSGKAVASTSGTSIDFTNIPSWVRRITVLLNGVSTSGTSLPMIQLGDAGGIEATGYTGDSAQIHTGAAGSALSTGFSINTAVAANVLYGQATITYFGSNTWIFAFVGGTTGNPFVLVTGGAKVLTDTLTQVRVTTVNGTDTFDLGSINILYE